MSNRTEHLVETDKTLAEVKLTVEDHTDAIRARYHIGISGTLGVPDVPRSDFEYRLDWHCWHTEARTTHTHAGIDAVETDHNVRVRFRIDLKHFPKPVDFWDAMDYLATRLSPAPWRPFLKDARESRKQVAAKYHTDLTYREIARELGYHHQTVKSAAHWLQQEYPQFFPRRHRRKR